MRKRIGHAVHFWCTLIALLWIFGVAFATRGDGEAVGAAMFIGLLIFLFGVTVRYVLTGERVNKWKPSDET